MIEPPRYAKPEALLKVPEYGHSVIEASAGTGKTYTIEHLVVDLLVTQGVAIDEILVVTFTIKAATELKRRVRAKIRELLALEETTTKLSPEHCWVLNDEARERLKEAWVRFDAAAIHTIHGFCNKVLTENAFLNRRLFDGEIVDEQSFFGEVFKDVLRRKLAADEALVPYLVAWLEDRGFGIETLEKLLYRASRIRGLSSSVFDPAEILAAAARFPKLGPELLEDVPKVSRAKVERNLDALAAALENDDVSKLLAGLERVELAYLTAKVPRLFQPIRELQTRTVSFSEAIVQRFLPLVDAEARRRKWERGLFDFDDPLRLVSESLSGPTGEELARVLRARYRTALIDEFQDTDEIQWRIFRKIFFDTPGHHPLRLVGDPKQAIYGFRGADVHVYLDAKRTVVSRSTLVPLSENYRSTSELIDALNLVFHQDADEPFFTGAVRYDWPVRPGGPALGLLDAGGAPASPVVLMRPSWREAKPSLGVAKEAIRERFAEEIRQLLDTPLSFGEKGREKPVGAEDIFVLTRTAREGYEMGAALEARGVPHLFYKQEGLFQRPEALDVRDLLAALEDPRDLSKRFRAWLTPFFGLSLKELERARDVPQEHPLMARLMDWKALAESKEYEALFTCLTGESGVVRRLLFKGGEDRALTNYAHLFEILLEEVHDRRASLSELVGSLDRYIEGRGLPPGQDRDIQRLENDGPSVQIMTMHMAKGLEAAVIFVYAFARYPSSSVHAYYEGGVRRRYAGRLADAPAEIRTAIEREEREEDQRLLYVALTRAKGRLYLPLLPPEILEDRCYVQLNDRLHELLGVFEVENLATPAPPPPVSAIDDERLSQWRPPRDLLGSSKESSRFAALSKRHHGHVITSYSRMKMLRGGYHVPIEEPADLADESIPGGVQTGVFLHEVLEAVDFQTFRESPDLEAWRGRDDVRKMFHHFMRRNGIDHHFRGDAERLVHTALTTPIVLGGKRLADGFHSVAKSLREVEFVYPYPEEHHPTLGDEPPRGTFRIGRGYVKGFVDFVFEHDGLTYFADWKSDVLPSWSAEAVNAHVHMNYRLQAQLYSLALIRMLAVGSESDYEIRFGGILYCFLRGMPEHGIRFARPSWEKIRGWQEELAREQVL